MGSAGTSLKPLERSPPPHCSNSPPPSVCYGAVHRFAVRRAAGCDVLRVFQQRKIRCGEFHGAFQLPSSMWRAGGCTFADGSWPWSRRRRGRPGGRLGGKANGMALAGCGGMVHTPFSHSEPCGQFPIGLPMLHVRSGPVSGWGPWWGGRTAGGAATATTAAAAGTGGPVRGKGERRGKR